jgi:hypothetical protein
LQPYSTLLMGFPGKTYRLHFEQRSRMGLNRGKNGIEL